MPCYNAGFMSDLQWHAVRGLETSMGIKVENPQETYCRARTINWKIIMLIVNCISHTRPHHCFYSLSCSDCEMAGCKTRVKCFCSCCTLVLGEAVLNFVLPFIIVS